MRIILCVLILVYYIKCCVFEFGGIMILIFYSNKKMFLNYCYGYLFGFCFRFLDLYFRVKSLVSSIVYYRIKRVGFRYCILVRVWIRVLDVFI